MPIKVNLKGQQGFSSNLTVIPAGIYGLSVFKAELGKSHAGNDKLKLVFQVESDDAHAGQYVGRRIFHDMPIMDTDASKGRLVDLLRAVGFTAAELDDEAFELEPSELKGLTARAEIIIKSLPGRKAENGGAELEPAPVNDIKRWIFPQAENNSASAGTAQQTPLEWAESADTAAYNEYAEDPAPTDTTLAQLVSGEAPSTVVLDVPAYVYTVPADVKISQRAKLLAIEHQIDFTGKVGTGPGLTFTVNDIEKLIAEKRVVSDQAPDSDLSEAGYQENDN